MGRRWIVCVTPNFIRGNHAVLCWGGDTARRARRDFWHTHQAWLLR